MADKEVTMYYDEYRNVYYNPDDVTGSTIRPGKNANWKAIQRGFALSAERDQLQDTKIAQNVGAITALIEDVYDMRVKVNEDRGVITDGNTVQADIIDAIQAGRMSFILITDDHGLLDVPVGIPVSAAAGDIPGSFVLSGEIAIPDESTQAIQWYRYEATVTDNDLSIDGAFGPISGKNIRINPIPTLFYVDPYSVAIQPNGQSNVDVTFSGIIALPEIAGRRPEPNYQYLVSWVLLAHQTVIQEKVTCKLTDSTNDDQEPILVTNQYGATTTAKLIDLTLINQTATAGTAKGILIYRLDPIGPAL